MSLIKVGTETKKLKKILVKDGSSMKLAHTGKIKQNLLTEFYNDSYDLILVRQNGDHFNSGYSRVYALDKDGVQRWSRNFGRDRSVYIKKVIGDFAILELDYMDLYGNDYNYEHEIEYIYVRNGQRIWKVQTGWNLRDTVSYLTDEDYLYAVNRSNSEMKKYKLSDGTIVFENKSVIYGKYRAIIDGGRYLVLDETGDVKTVRIYNESMTSYTEPLSNACSVTPEGFHYSGDHFYIADRDGIEKYTLDFQLVWKKVLCSKDIAYVEFRDDAIYVERYADIFYRVSYDGEILLNKTLNFEDQSPIVIDGYHYVNKSSPSLSDPVRCYDSEGTLLWSRASSEVSRIGWKKALGSKYIVLYNEESIWVYDKNMIFLWSKDFDPYINEVDICFV